ncbi:hypothetical protein COU17_01825 [Candidatus Kaiserbacteria bacterium CG10_big_fil_rev_8_21_14_0_10_49_17]|uniref:Uncharacterized protein n=1 Tax=Candidatus Kaiserbacteria bacterium CG10_big_fil_rev_8_21_14_0_10_49_17 TaxID=1974609 RepID=A0A2M6WEE9_9BACT|nr:MAG: hypothetical protein COU17_01825 [Candidatus Kaiserbacteria bacterium CG10_big_fil_rev_8_21_14_0_10_49_17]
MTLHTSAQKVRGASLIDVLVGISLMLIVFLGIFGAFQLAIELVTSNKAKTGALALANERLEYIRALSYGDVGTVGGIPSGALVQEEEILLNQTTYTRRTFVQYVDAPEDGEGTADENGITADYKKAKVEVLWESRGSLRLVSLVTTIVPAGIETLDGGGTLALTVFDALGVPIPSAEVTIVNNETDPVIDVSTFTNTDGKVFFPGSPEAASYEIFVTKNGMSTAKTYSATPENPNPSPGHLTVLEGQTTSASFAIDTFGTITVRTWEPIGEGVWQDTFDTSSKISQSYTVVVADGALTLLDSGSGYPSEGSVYSLDISPLYLAGWGEARFADETPQSTDILYRLYYIDSESGVTAVPDGALPGNASGFTTSPIDLSHLSVEEYPSLELVGFLTSSDASSTPEILDWEITYSVGPTPLPNIDFSLTGSKTIGADGSGSPIYKTATAHATGPTGSETVESVEWDSYTVDIDGIATGYDIAESCTPQPLSLEPGENASIDLYLQADSDHSLLVDVTDSEGALLPQATVELSRNLFSESETTSACGQVFFSDLSEGTVASGNPYTLTVTLTGYQQEVISSVDISGASRISVSLSQ